GRRDARAQANRGRRAADDSRADRGGIATALRNAQAGRVGADREIVGRRGAATGILEGADACLPVEAAIGWDVFIGVPEGAAVGRVYRHRAVVTPTAVIFLRASAHDQ